ncbi:ATP-binding protein [Mycobacterium antarcticum]|uniref:ATP-binding protein n=1 Tax=Mycolicibacterium sp. TUM20984 TaxID=3023368 RepID=UPI00239AFFBC|nr:LuxR family transcriptional regulator [Mycolicibacterium sp. TUM20984]GLP81743.1 transcriptional regulator [Mycolicibacterium sp. TUM20984]
MTWGGATSHRVEARVIDEYLTSASREPSALLIEGEAGIGKTTLWSAATDRARERGCQVLSSRTAVTESLLAYGVLADLLDEIDESVWGALPGPQRVAVERILLRVNSTASTTDPRTVAAGFLSVIEVLAARGPVVLAVDDLQWVDVSSQHVVAFAAQRLTGPVRMLATVRSDSDVDTSWLQLPRPDALTRLRLQPMPMRELHAMISERLGRSFARPTIKQIQDISGGNPFYALELARAIGPSTDSMVALPNTLAELVAVRLGGLEADAGEALLVAACLPAPTMDLVARATRTSPHRVAQMFGDVEDKGIVAIDGQRIRFTHPLLSQGVYALATPARRRATHRRLAATVDQAELRARHLALSATSGDAATMNSLDAAAESARARGAPAAAAEFVDLAIKLGGDTPRRRLQAASHHFSDGDAKQARMLLEDVIAMTEPGVLRAEASCLLGFVHLFGESFLEAAGVLEGALDEAGDDTRLRTELLVTLSYARYNAGQFGRATRRIDEATVIAERLGQPILLSQALGLRVILGFLRGDGLDQDRLSRAQQLEDVDVDMPMAFRPRMQNAMLLAWTGRLDLAHDEMTDIRRRCIERGEENELIFVAIHAVLLEMWRGNFTDAGLIAEDTEERARYLGGDVPLFVAMTIRAALAAYAGREGEARRDTAAALAASQRCGANLLVVWTLTTLGFLELSLGNYEATLTATAPLLARLEAAPRATEIVSATFVPDAVEAMVNLGRLDDAERLVDILEGNGRRLDRAWMLAVGARSRAMVLAARGDIDASLGAIREATAQCDRLPMPFEHARTQLLLGQIERRHRRKDAAAAAFTTALKTFEALNVPLWADRARAELDRNHTGPRRKTVLTPSEQRVAELAATGKTTRDIAVALFISPKTVEANLARIYRKLDIRSRAELGSRMRAADAQ